MQSRAARGTGYRGRGVAVRRAVAGMIESLESRRLMSVTNLIEAVDESSAGASAPADTHGAAGPNHLVNVVNSQIEWYTKAGTNENSQTLNSFFAPLGTTANSVVFNPKVVYDQYNQRFVVVALWLEQISNGDLVNDSHAMLAVSDNADPNGAWYYQDIDTKVTINGGETWLDYPGLAVSKEAIYVTGNMFSFDFATTQPTVANDFGVEGTRLFIVPNAPLYSGGQSFVQPGGFDPVGQLGLTPGEFEPAVPLFLTLQPAQMYGTTPTGLGTFLTIDAGDDSTGRDRLYVIRVDNPLGVPVFTPTLIDVGDVSTRRFSGAPQPWSDFIISQFRPGGGGATTLRVATNDARVLSAVWRNGMLYATQEVIPPTGIDKDQVTAHWYQINTGTATAVGTPALYDQGNIGGEEIGLGTYTFFPSVAVSPNGDMAIGFSASGPAAYTNNQPSSPVGNQIFPGAYVTARLARYDPQGINPVTGEYYGFTRPAQVLAAGGGVISDGTQWGDYSATVVDIDTLGNELNAFWAYNMYALAPTGPTPPGLPPESPGWGTRWGRFTAELRDLPAVGNLVWVDFDGDGVRDPGEPGVAGVIFRLVDAAGNVVQQVTSDALGMWYLEASPTGGAVAGTSYYVTADIGGTGPTGLSLFDGFTFSPANRGGKEETDSDFTMLRTAVGPLAANAFQAVVGPILFSAGMFNEDVDLGLFKPFAKVTAATPTVQEGGPGSVRQAAYTVTLKTGILDDGTQQDAVSPWTTRIYYSTIAVSATQGVDYVGRATELFTIAPLVSSSTLDLVPVLGDALPEGEESFLLTLLQPSDIFGFVNDNLPPGVSPQDLPLADTVQFLKEEDRTASVAIKDDDLAIVSVDAGPTVIEPGAGKVTYALFTIRLNVPNPLKTPVSVRYKLIDGTATGGTVAEAADYSNAGGVVDFAPGQLTKTVRVPVYGDFRGKERNETFTLEVEVVNAGQLTNDVLARRQATATIVNLSTKTVTFTAGKSVTFRDVAGNQVTVTLTGPGRGSVVTSAGGAGVGLQLDGTTEKSVLTIRTNRGQANFGGITVNGGLARLDAPTTNLSGSVTSTEAIRQITLNFVTGGEILIGASSDPDGVVSINIKRIANSSLSSDTSIREMVLGSWIDTGEPDLLVAPAVRTIRATGDFGATVQPSSGDIQSVTVGGVLKNALISVMRPGSGQARGVIGSVTAGSIQGSRIEAGARVNSVIVRHVFSNSSIEAPQIGTLELGKVKNTTNDVMVAARADRIGSVRWTFNGTTTRITNVDNPGIRGLDKDVVDDPQIVLEIL